jgi:hypothetical protein
MDAYQVRRNSDDGQRIKTLIRRQSPHRPLNSKLTEALCVGHVVLFRMLIVLGWLEPMILQVGGPAPCTCSGDA